MKYYIKCYYQTGCNIKSGPHILCKSLNNGFNLFQTLFILKELKIKKPNFINHNICILED